MADVQKPDPFDEETDELIEDVHSYFRSPEPAETDDPPEDTGDAYFEPDFGNAFDDIGEYDEETMRRRHPEFPNEKRKWKRHFKKFKFPAIIKLAIYFAIVAVLAVVLARVGWALADDVLALTRPDIDVEITVNDTDTVDDIAQKLKDAGAIKYDWLFKFYCKFTEKENYFDPGVYTVNLTCDYSALVNHLMATTGSRETVTIMVVEGASCSEIFDLLEKENVCTRAKLEQCAATYDFDYDFLRRVPYGEPNRLEGYLFPDTYEFYLMDDPEKVLDRFLKNFDNRLDEDLREEIANSPYTMHEILTMASIIEGEAANDSERPLVASVIYNRLRDWENPLLGMDSTVYYGAKLLGTSFSTELNSPYNTYLYPGLPQGPINNPGLNSIRAALRPEETSYYYFATGVEGLNHFFKTEEEFLEFINSEEFKPQQ